MHFPDFKLLYLHAPKTAGNAIQSALIDYSDDARTVNGFQDGIERFDILGPKTRRKHATLENYSQTLGTRLSDYKVAMSVRHPFDRALSYYFSPHQWFERKSDGTYDQLEPYWDTSRFEEYISQMLHLVDFVRLDDEIKMPDFLIRYESLAHDFRCLANAIGLTPKDAKLTIKNQSADKLGIRSSLIRDAGLRSMVLDVFSDDMETFDYH